jgi:hypothetical protein
MATTHTQNRSLEHVALYMLRITHNLLLFILQFKIYVKLSVWEITGCFIGKIVVIPLKNLTDPNLPSENSTCRLLYAYLIVLYFVLESKDTFRWRSNKFQLLFHSTWCIPIRNSCCTRSIWCETESQTLKLFVLHYKQIDSRHKYYVIVFQHLFNRLLCYNKTTIWSQCNMQHNTFGVYCNSASFRSHFNTCHLFIM